MTAGTGDDFVVGTTIARQPASAARQAGDSLERVQQAIDDALFYEGIDDSETRAVNDVARLAMAKVIDTRGIALDDPRIAVYADFAQCTALYAYIYGRQSPPRPPHQ